MKHLIFLFLVAPILHSCLINKKFNDNNLDLYKQAYSTIYKHEKQNLKILPEIVSFSNYAFFFMDELLATKLFVENDFINQNSSVTGDIINVNSFEQKSINQNYLFFSSIKNDYFFVETFLDNQKRIRNYGEIPEFGISKTYLFHVNKSGKVALITLKDINYG